MTDRIAAYAVQGKRLVRQHRSGTPESAVLAAVRKWAARYPDVYLVRVVQAGASGVPDLLLCIRGRFVGVECKAPGKKPTALQLKHGADIERTGGLFLWGDGTTLIPELERIYHANRDT